MNYSRVCGALTTAALLITSSAMAESTAPGGYLQINVPANSDAFVSVPFTRPATFKGKITGVSPLTVASAHGASAATHYVRVIRGSKDGQWSTVATAPTATTLTLADASVQAGIAIGDEIIVYPHQTLSSVFPASLAGISFIPSFSASDRRTEILEMDNTSIQQNKSAAAVYFYLSGVWRKTGSGLDWGGYVLPPDKPFIIRNKLNTNPLPFITSGDMEMNRTGRAIPGSTNNDLFVAPTRTFGMTLNQLMLGGTTAFRNSDSASARHDELLVFNNAATGQNKSAAFTYYYLGGVWRRTGSGLDWGNDPSVLPAGTGFIIRRKSTGATPPASVDWFSLPNY